MAQNTTGFVPVAGALRSIADDGIVVYASDVYDSSLKMTQSEINLFDGGITGSYGWLVMTLEKYDEIEHKEHVLYFIEDTDLEEQEHSTVSINTLFLAGVLSNQTITVTGKISNNTLTLN